MVDWDAVGAPNTDEVAESVDVLGCAAANEVIGDDEKRDEAPEPRLNENGAGAGGWVGPLEDRDGKVKAVLAAG